MMLDENCIFVDTNVLVGAFVNNANDSRCLQYLYSLKGKRLFISSLSIAQYVATLQHRKFDPVKIADSIRNLIAKFNVISFTEKDVEDFLKYVSVDMEDAIQYVISGKMNCHYFVTNNYKHYRGCFMNIDVLKPKEIRRIDQ